MFALATAVDAPNDPTPWPDSFIAAAYNDLRRLAHAYCDRLAPNTLTATAILHEALMRVRRAQVRRVKELPGISDAGHFIATVASTLRHTIIEHLRSRNTAKRGGGWKQVPLSEVMLSDDPTRRADAMVLHEAIESLRRVRPEAAVMVDLRALAGYTEQEAADVLGMSLAAARRLWKFARAWLQARLTDPE